MDEQIQAQRKKRIFPKVFWSIIIVFLIFFGFIFAKAYNFSSNVFVRNVSFLQRIEALLFHRDSTIQTASDRINILLLGYGGPGHDGPYLTDSMILASIKPSTRQILLTSIPRDTMWRNENGYAEKINQAFSDGITQNNYDIAKGGEEAEKAVSQLTGQDVKYFASMDFAGFVKMIDTVGGVDVNVLNDFTDYQFPAGETTSFLPPQVFTKGQQHMDGERALIYARSRHAAGAEGSDFARSKRQQQILEAFKTKVASLNLFSDVSKINSLTGIVAKHFHTNLEPNDLVYLADLLKGSEAQVLNQSLDESTGLVCQDMSTGVFYMAPCSGIGDQQIKDFFANGFDAALVRKESPTVIIENAGNYNLYKLVLNNLKSVGATIYEIPYKGIPLASSALYEVKQKTATEKYLEKILGVKHQQKPTEMIAGADFVAIIGGF